MGTNSALQIAAYRHMCRIPIITIISKLLDVNLISIVIFNVIKSILLEKCLVKSIKLILLEKNIVKSKLILLKKCLVKSIVLTLCHTQVTEHRCRIDGCSRNLPDVSFGPETRCTIMSFLIPYVKLLEGYDDYCLRCDAVYTERSLPFWWRRLLPSSSDRRLRQQGPAKV